MNLKLVKASTEYRRQISDMMEEWNNYGEIIFQNSQAVVQYQGASTTDAIGRI